MKIAKFLFVMALLCPMVGWSFSVGTLNLYHYTERLSERKANLDTELRVRGTPDIMGFQEAARWRGFEMPFDYFVRQTGFQGIYEATNRFGVVTEGLALASRFKALHLESVRLPDTRTFSNQAVNFGVYAVSGGQVLVVNTHLSPYSQAPWRRVEQAHFILEQLRRFPPLPVVIVGDINDTYDSETLYVFRKAGFVDIAEGRGATYDPTTNPLLAGKPYGPVRLDYILYQPDRLRLIRFDWMCRENWVSDHYGLKAEFQIR